VHTFDHEDGKAIDHEDGIAKFYYS